MCLWILTVWIQFHFVFFVISINLENEVAKRYLIENRNQSNADKYARTNQDHKKQDIQTLEKTQQNFKNLFNRNGTNKPEANTENLTATNIFVVKKTIKTKASTNTTFTTKLTFNILKLNKTKQEDAKNASYRRNEKITHELDLFLYNKSRSQLAITPYDKIRKDNSNVKIIKESKRNNTKRNDTKNSRNTSKVIKGNRVKFGRKEYIIPKNGHDSKVRAIRPKIERYRLGSLHFSHEIDIFKENTSKALTPYTTMYFDSDEDVTPNPVVFKQQNNIDDADYKIPEDAFMTRDTRPIDYFLTTTVIVRLTTAKRTTEKPFRSELHQERVLMKMGPFTFFIYKLMEFLAMKRPSRLTKELTDQFLDVSLQLFQERPNLFDFGQPFRLGVVDFFTNIRTYPGDTLQRMASIFHKALPKRWELFHVLVNVLYERIDQLYQQSEIQILSNLLEDLKNYPNIGKNATQFARSILVDAIVNPFTREGKTTRRLEMLARLNAYISFSFYGGQYLDVPGFNEEETLSPNTDFTPPKGIFTGKLRPSHTLPSTQRLQTVSGHSGNQGFVTTSMNVTENHKVFDNGTQVFENSVAQSFETASMTPATRGYEKTVKNIETTKEVERSGTKNRNEQETDIITDEEDVLKKRIYRGSHAMEKSELHDEDMLSSYLKYVSKHKPTENRFTNKKEIPKHPNQVLKQILRQSSNLAKKIQNNKKIKTKGEGLDDVVFEFIGKANSSIDKSFSNPPNLSKIWKEILGTNEGRDKNIEKKGLPIEHKKIKISNKLEDEKFKINQNKSLNNGMSHTSSIEKISSENILQKKIEIYNDASRLINRNTDSQASTKTTDSFLDLLLKLDELVNSGERGVLDEILNSDDKIKDSTFQKIEAENEKFLEKEAAVNIVRKPKKIHTTTKDNTQSEFKKKVKSLHPDHDKIYEKVKFTKGYVEDELETTSYINNLERDEVYETTKAEKNNIEHELKKLVKTKNHKRSRYQKLRNFSVTQEKYHKSDITKGQKFQQHSKEVIRSIKNQQPSSKNYNQKDINTFSKDEELTLYYEKKKIYREQSDHKSKKTVKNDTNEEFYLQTQNNYVDEQSKEITNKTSIKPNIKTVTYQVTRKASTTLSNKKYYSTKKTIRKFKDYETKNIIYGKQQASKGFKDSSKTTFRIPTDVYTKDRATLKLFKGNKNDSNSKNHIRKTKKYYTFKKSQKVTEKHIFTQKSLNENQKDHKPSNSVSKHSTKRISKPGIPTENNSEEVFVNRLYKSKKHKHLLHKYPAKIINEQTTKYSIDDYDSSNDNVQKPVHENVNSIEDALNNLKRAATKYRPSERINEEFERLKRERNRRKKRKHSKIYRPLERIAGSVKITKKESKHIQLRNKKINSESYDEYGERTSTDNSIISEDIDNSAVWNPTKSMERAVKPNSDDYYIIRGGGQSKIIFQDEETRYELKKYNEDPKVSNKNLPGNSFDSSEKRNLMKNKKEKSDSRTRTRYTDKKTAINLKPRKRSKVNEIEEKKYSSELTEELLDKVIDQDSAAVPKNEDQNYEHDYDAPINEYTLKPGHNLNTEKVVFTTQGIFDDLKRLKNRLFHQDFRRNINRKHRITLNELFLKKRSNLKKIIEETSYSDDEQDLKKKLKDALIQGRKNEPNQKMRAQQNTTEISKKVENINQDENFNVVIDSTNEELVLKSNIYKGLGFKQFN